MSEDPKRKFTLRDEQALKKGEDPSKPKTVHTASGQFAPGFSGNPGGRPKVVEEVRKLAQLRSTEAMKLVYHIMVDENQKTSDRLAAIRLILQAAGAMIQKTETTIKQEDELSEISAEELKKFLQKADIKS